MVIIYIAFLCPEFQMHNRPVKHIWWLHKVYSEICDAYHHWIDRTDVLGKGWLFECIHILMYQNSTHWFSKYDDKWQFFYIQFSGNCNFTLILICVVFLISSRVVRKSIARVLTVMNQTQKENLRKLYRNKKYKPKDLRPKKTRAMRRALTKHELAIRTVKQQRKDRAFPMRKYALKA